MVLPDPVIYEHYIDTTSSTTYWGELDGRRLDFSKNEDRLAACKWYIDRVRAAFAAGNYRYVELAGFYWLREIVTRPQDTAYSYFLTRSDILLPHVADYLHRLNYSFNWIPYYGSRGYDVWPTFGFDPTIFNDVPVLRFILLLQQERLRSAANPPSHHRSGGPRDVCLGAGPQRDTLLFGPGAVLRRQYAPDALQVG